MASGGMSQTQRRGHHEVQIRADCKGGCHCKEHACRRIGMNRWFQKEATSAELAKVVQATLVQLWPWPHAMSQSFAHCLVASVRYNGYRRVDLCVKACLPCFGGCDSLRRARPPRLTRDGLRNSLLWCPAGRSGRDVMWGGGHTASRINIAFTSIIPMRSSTSNFFVLSVEPLFCFVDWGLADDDLSKHRV